MKPNRRWKTCELLWNTCRELAFTQEAAPACLGLDGTFYKILAVALCHADLHCTTQYGPTRKLAPLPDGNPA